MNITSTGAALHGVFYTDGSGALSGFQIEYVQVDRGKHWAHEEIDRQNHVSIIFLYKVYQARPETAKEGRVICLTTVTVLNIRTKA